MLLFLDFDKYFALFFGEVGSVGVAGLFEAGAHFENTILAFLKGN
jgi:hypothetical protein